jgi:hypothetical protein
MEVMTGGSQTSSSTQPSAAAARAKRQGFGAAVFIQQGTSSSHKTEQN